MRKIKTKLNKGYPTLLYFKECEKWGMLALPQNELECSA